MAKEWYKSKGFKSNPLHVEPKFYDPLFGHDVLLDELFYRINAGNILFIEGVIGKTAILLKIIEKYKGKGKVAYVNCEKVKDEPNIKVLLANGKKNINTAMPGLPKRMIVLLDNVKEISVTNAEKIKYYYDQGNILSLIMTGEDMSKVEIPDSIKHRIGNRVYKLRSLTKDEEIDIIMERLNFSDFFKEKYIRKLSNKAKNIKELLNVCDSALFLMANEGLQAVDDKVMEELTRKKENEKDMV